MQQATVEEVNTFVEEASTDLKQAIDNTDLSVVSTTVMNLQIVSETQTEQKCNF